MAAGSSGAGSGLGDACKHHAQLGVCESRAKYREGRRPRAVKVYTINLESRYLLIQGVPALGVMKELVEQFALYGAIEEYHALDEYPAEQFTEVYLIKFQKLQCARVAKKKMDERSFFGSLLHVCYAPEFETVQETREKLQDRRKYIAKATNQRDCLVSKKVEEREKTISKNSGCLWSTPGSCTTGNWDPSCFTSLHRVSQNTGFPPGNHRQSLLTFPQYDNNCAETSGYFSQSASLTLNVQPGRRIPPAPLMQQRTVLIANGVDRFLPRTTHLQERKRRREEGNKFSLKGTSVDNTEVIIGPQLPEVPKVDMDDDSLNTSASLIRNKLKEVADSVSRTSVEKPESSSAKPLLKQRRRI
ncbi:RNA-binding protein 48 [Mesitornis unicolor]|uniref:RNA-binding protein 48 n=1 Tax=Mesitornis unicolor TaxID=54374 RepID=A0A091RHF3_9AVES|nr:PREDICTED: RNA-binding protein 48 [Mesitornis unicolor]KFQ39298.1 RNA-binding protein 48 [Mesitornis unicolor]